MTYIRMLLIGLMAAASIAAAGSPLPVDTALAPNNRGAASLAAAIGTRSEIAEPISVMSRPRDLPVTDSPPPFGTIMESWELPIGGSWGGAGITWRPDSGRFYLVNQGYVYPPSVWSCDPFDPLGTLRQENWVLPNMDTDTADIPWGIAWDSDSNCFWISNILDGSVYNGCYYVRMRQTAVGDTWRWFPENAGDTWLVSNAGDMYWMGGSKKWLGRDYFACTPIAPNGANNYVWKFDPYTKTGLGRLPHGNTVSERGCGLIPWDSNYVLTTGWNANYMYKRDSTGLALESVMTVEAPSDVVLWVPPSIGPDDTVFIYTILNDTRNTFQKRSAGLLWRQLPSMNASNLRPAAILAPAGTVDSGQIVTPCLVVQNNNVPAEGATAYFVIGIDGVPVYSDSLTGLYLDMWTTETLAFTGWTSDGRDTMSVIAWTNWQGDSFPQDDTIRSRFLVRVRDIAVTEIVTPSPDTVVDSGAVFTPQCRVWNYGNVALSFDVKFRIGSWQATRNVSIIPRGAKLVTAPTSYTAMPGIWTCRASAVVIGDLHPENNTKADTFTVSGAITKDVDARAVLAPTGVVDTGQTVTPRGRFGNNGVDVASCFTFFSILDSGGAGVYAESIQVMLNPGDSTDVEYPTVKFPVVGIYTATCSVAMDGDQNVTNDMKVDSFQVGGTGVAQAPGVPSSFGLSPIPNPCHSRVRLVYVLPPGTAVLRLYDIAGRAVLIRTLNSREKQVTLDLRHLNAGIYVLRLSAGTFTCSQKMVLQY